MMGNVTGHEAVFVKVCERGNVARPSLLFMLFAQHM